MRNGIIVCRLSLIKTYLLAFHVLRKFRDSAPLNQVGGAAVSYFSSLLELDVFRLDDLSRQKKYRKPLKMMGTFSLFT